MSDYLYVSWNKLNELGYVEEAEEDFEVRLVPAVNEGATSYYIEYLSDQFKWERVTEEPIHFLGQHLVEASKNSVLSQIMGVAEVAKFLGVDKRVLAVMIERNQFIPPVIELEATPIWLKPDVMNWKAIQGNKKITAHRPEFMDKKKQVKQS